MPTGIYERTPEMKTGKHPNSGFQKGYHSKTEFKKGHPPTKGSFKKGDKSGNYKGGETINDGYIYIWQPSHPRALKGGYVLRSHLIIEKIIRRYLKKREIVHHRNKIKDDDRPENLMAFINDSVHQRFHHNPDNVKSSEIIFDGHKLLKLSS